MRLSGRSNAGFASRSARRPWAILVAPLALGVWLSGCAQSNDPPESTDNAADASDGTQVDNATETEDPGAAHREFFAGKTIHFIVPFREGGGYDTAARLLAPHIADRTGATVVVQNVTGAAGLVALNSLSVAEPDGLTILIAPMTNGIILELGESQGIEYGSISDFSFIGRTGYFPEVQAVASGGRFPDFDAFFEATESDPARFVSVGLGDNHHIAALVTSEAFGIPIKLITGFDLAPEAQAALLRGDVDAMNASITGGLVDLDAPYDSDTMPVLIWETERDERLPDTPTVLEMMERHNAQQHENLLLALIALNGADRGIIAPPGVPEDRLSFLRDIYEDIATDPAILEDMERNGWPISYLSGQEWHDMVSSLTATPPQAFLEVVKTAFGQAG